MQLDAWLQLRPQMRKDDLEPFHAVALRGLTESDPRLELALGEHWQVGGLGKVRAYSSDCSGRTEPAQRVSA